MSYAHGMLSTPANVGLTLASSKANFEMTWPPHCDQRFDLSNQKSYFQF